MAIIFAIRMGADSGGSFERCQFLRREGTKSKKQCHLCRF
jgi:hypothetical protein